MRRLTLVSLCALLLVQGQDVTFKAESNLVIVNVAVRDKQGRPVLDLKKEDFVLLEDGKPQTLEVFELQRLEGEARPTGAAATPGTTVATIAPDAAQPAKNTPTPIRYQDKRLIGLFFDMAGMSQVEQGRAIDSATEWVKTKMQPADVVAIMAYSNKFKIIQEFTTDRDLLVETIAKFQPGEGTDAGAAGSQVDEDDDSGGFTADETEFNIFNTDVRLSALETACRKLSIFPEKKALIYFSSGVGKTGMENQAQLRATINSAVRANVSFYPVDARGLQASAPAGNASDASPRGTAIFRGTTQQNRRNSFNDSQETLYSLAADTGGKTLLDSNDLSLGIQQAQKDIASYYILGYYSGNVAQDGRYRKVQVKLNRAGLEAKLDYRDGYYAQKTWAKFNSSDKERQLEEALSSGDPVSELPLALEVDYFRIAKTRYFVPISVKIPGSTLATVKKKGSESTELDFIGQVRDAKGKLVGGVRDGIQIKLSESDAAALAKKSLHYDSGLSLEPGEYRLKFLARENQTGKMGTFETKFSIPDLSSQSKGLRVSSVIWSNQREKLTAAVGSAGQKVKELEKSPLVAEGQKLVPSITRVFRRDQTLLVYLEVYDPSLNDAKKASVVAELELLQGGKRVFQSQPLRRQDLAEKRINTLPLQFQVPLNRLAPGEYIAQVNVIDSEGKKFAFPRGNLVVLGN